MEQVKPIEHMYQIWENDTLISSGDLNKVAKETGLSPTSLTLYANQYTDIAEGWRVKRLDRTIPHGRIDIQRINTLMSIHKYTIRELASVIGIKPHELRYKLEQHRKFRESELSKIEDLFFLNDGELLV